MKKLKSILQVSAVGLGLLACDRVGEDIIPQQQNEVNEIGIPGRSSRVFDLNSTILSTGSSDVEVSKTPKNGNLSFLENGLLRYEPNNDFTKLGDHFELDFLDNLGKLLKREAYQITVVQDSTGNPCINGAVMDFMTLIQGEVVIVNILDNDSICQDSVTSINITIVDPPINGTAQLNSDNTITYISDSSTIGFDSLIYSLNINGDGTQHNSQASVLFTILPHDTCDFQLFSDSLLIDSLSHTDSLGVEIPVFENDVLCDVGFSSLTLTTPQNGTAWISDINAVRPKVFYRPNAGYLGHDEFEYSLCPSTPGSCQSATVQLIIQ